MVKNCTILLFYRKKHKLLLFILNFTTDIFIAEKEVGGGWYLIEGGSKNFWKNIECTSVLINGGQDDKTIRCNYLIPTIRYGRVLLPRISTFTQYHLFYENDF